jgi:transposase
MIQGARGAVRTAARKDDARHRWVQRLRRQKGFNKAAVALANKNARTLWALVVNASEYQPA